MPPYTGKETRIIMSFAMKNGGDLFSSWLRNELMKSLGYYSANSIYLDTVGSRQAPVVGHGLTMDAAKSHASDIALSRMEQGFPNVTSTHVAPDLRKYGGSLKRFKDNPGEHISIGAMNDEWDNNFLKAMSEALVMLIIYTQDYRDSQWCMQELEQYENERISRMEEGRKQIKLVVVSFRGGAPVYESVANASGATGVLGEKIHTTGGHPTALGAGGTGWAVSDADYNRVYGAVSTAMA